MKKNLRLYFIYFTMVASLAFMSSCATYSNGRGNNGMPPGKAKKIFGTKSAKPFAPGQQKKKDNRGKGKRKGNKGKSHKHQNVFWLELR